MRTLATRLSLIYLLYKLTPTTRYNLCLLIPNVCLLIRRQERRKHEALAKAEEAASQEESEIDLIKNVPTENVVEAETENPAEKLAVNAVDNKGLNFKCEQCAYTNVTERGLSQHARMRQRISHVDVHINSEEEDSEEVHVVILELEEVDRSHSKKNLRPLCQEECGDCLNGMCEECEYEATE